VSPHTLVQVRTLFSRDMRESVLAALAAGCTRLRTFQEFPELNVEMDTYRIGTLLEGIRDLVTELVMDGKRVRICVQGSLGVGVFSAMPLALAGVRRILESMDWDVTLPESDIRIGGIGEKEVQEDDDVLLLVAPQNISGHSIQPFIQEMCTAAGKRPVILINPRLAEIPSANGVMGVRGRQERLDFLATFIQAYHFRLIYNKPFIFPIYGSLRKAFGGPWELYKRTGSTNYNILDEEYVFRRAFAEEPTPSEITDAILG
jgi:adenylate kinase